MTTPLLWTLTIYAHFMVDEDDTDHVLCVYRDVTVSLAEPSNYVARKEDGEIMAEMRCWDDDAVQIHTDQITIEGGLVMPEHPKAPACDYGSWKLERES